MKRIKLLTPILTIPMAISGVTPLISSCSTKTPDYVKIAAEVQKTALEEFFKITKVPRPGYENGKIYRYLKNRITEIGLEPKDVGVGSIARGHHGKTAGGKDTAPGVKTLGDYTNIYYDIPASEGCDDYKPIILQAHMDMVRAGVGIEETETTTDYLDYGIDAKYYWEEGQWVVHSVDNQTSLGADDGIGLGALLSIGIHRNDFKHGKIRCLITYDEEVGLFGAEDIKDNGKWLFDGYDYLLSLDAEVDCGIVHASYGYGQHKFKFYSTEELPTSTGLIQVEIHGLHGGHSGEDIGFRWANGERLVFETLHALMVANPDATLQIAGCDHVNLKGDETSPKPNSLITDFRIWLKSDGITGTQIKGKFDELAAKTEGADAWRNKYSGENWDNVKFTTDSYTSTEDSIIMKADQTAAYINLLGNLALCGLYDIRDEQKHIPGTSSNVGPTTIELDDEKTTATLNSTLTARTDDDSILNDFMSDNPETITSEFKKYNHKYCFGEAFGTSVTYEIYDPSTVKCWHSPTIEQGNKLWKLLDEGFRNVAGNEPAVVSSYGGLECTTFHETKEDLTVISTGSLIKNCHTINETLYVNTMDNEYKALLYTLMNANNL